MEEISNCWVRAVRGEGAAADCAAVDRTADFLTREAVAPAYRIHRAMEGYRPTPLVRLDGLAEALGVKAVFVKDESRRFGLNAFKGLGAIYAFTRVVCDELGLDPETTTFADLQCEPVRGRLSGMVFVTATDGNHGKGVAWAAGQLGCRAYVYMPKGSSELRAQAIRDAGGAEVRIMDVGYDDAVRHAARMAEENGWHLVQDTSWEGYQQIPTWIVQGYTTMAAEAAEQLEAEGFPRPSHVFLQAGVGAMAGGVTGYLADRYAGNRPVFSTVEPEDMACIYKSILAADGEPHAVEGDCATIMAGLNCGEPCTVTWPVLRTFTSFAFSCADPVAALGMRLLAAPRKGDHPIVSGESGAATTGLLAVLAASPEFAGLRREMGLDGGSVVLLFSTEGDTDPEQYRSIVYAGKHALQ